MQENNATKFVSAVHSPA